jgi:probable HAF family extracellular repeat protein
MRNFLLAAPAVLAAAIAAPRPAAASLYNIQTYTYAAADKYNQAVGVTNNGLIVGTAAKNASSASTIDTSTSTAGPYTSFHPGTFTNTAAAAVSPSGLLAGTYTSGSKTVGFTYQLGATAPSGSVAVKTITPPSSTDTEPLAISNNGSYVTGYYYAPTVQDQIGFLYNGTTTTTLSVPTAAGTSPAGVNDSGTVVGTYINAQSNTVGFVYSNGSFTDLNVPGSPETNPVAINDSGEIVGYDYDASGDTFGFTYNPITTQFATFSAFGSLNTYVTGLDSTGDIIGYDGAGQGFVDSGGTISLLDIPGATLVAPTDILDNGTITGSYTTASNATDAFVATLATPVPEPGTVALLTLPLLATLTRRRPKSPAPL